MALYKLFFHVIGSTQCALESRLGFLSTFLLIADFISQTVTLAFLLVLLGNSPRLDGFSSLQVALFSRDSLSLCLLPLSCLSSASNW
jgi:hypothetical protein